MTRHDGLDVRIAPEVEETLQRADRSGQQLRARFLTQADRLAANGLEAHEAKKLGSLDLWELRVGDHRAFLCSMPATRMIAVGALVAKRRSRLRPKTLQVIERQVRGWADALSREGRDGRT